MAETVRPSSDHSTSYVLSPPEETTVAELGPASRTRPSATAVKASKTLALGGSFQGAIVTSVSATGAGVGPPVVFNCTRPPASGPRG